MAPVPQRIRFVLPILVPLALLGGCGQDEEPILTDGAAPIGTAAEALSCPADVGTESESVDGAGTADGPVAALERWLRESPEAPDVPPEEFGVAVEEVGTVLLTHEVEGHAVVAVITSDAATADGGPGWAVQSWARCAQAAGG